MKIASNIFFTIIAFLLSFMTAFAGGGGAGGGPPQPSPTGKRPPSPPGLPIDENLFALLIIALVYGIYIIYKHRLKTKTPV